MSDWIVSLWEKLTNDILFTMMMWGGAMFLFLTGLSNMLKYNKCVYSWGYIKGCLAIILGAFVIVCWWHYPWPWN